MKRIFSIVFCLMSFSLFAVAGDRHEKPIDFENPGLIDQTGTFSPEFINEQNLRIKEFTEKTGIILRVIYTSTADMTAATGTLLKGIDDSRYALLWICVRNQGAYYAVGDALFDVYTTKACTYIKAKTEKAMRRKTPEEAVSGCISYSVSYGEKTVVGRFFYEYGIAVFLVLILCFGVSMGVVFRKRQNPFSKK